MLTHTGETLSSYITSNKSLNFKKKMGLLNCIASGLMSIHELGLVHRDFHDRNILIANHQNGIYPYIIDLGLCRKEDEKDRDKYYGLPQYLPPEYFQNQNSQYKRPADVYAFGIVTHLLLTGKLPFKENCEG
jgi:eukaryotic-like serine/threonine-protein kinase